MDAVDRSSLYARYCTFWEEVLDALLPTGGLQDWGASLYVELTRHSPAPELDPRTTAKRECERLACEVEKLAVTMAELSNTAAIVDYSTLGQRSYKLSRTADLMSNIIDELIILHNEGLIALVEAEKEHILNYQIFRF